MRIVAPVIIVLACLFSAADARAEAGEWVIGAGGALVLPALTAPDATSFALATWGVDVHAQYGLLDDVFVEGRALFGMFGARVKDSEEVRGRLIDGTRAFDLQQLNLELGLRYNLFAGYDIAPFVEAHVGALWASFRQQRMLDDSGRDFGVEITDRGVLVPTVSGGLAIEWRIWNVAFLGVGVRWTEVFGERLYRRFVSVPLRAAYYW